jgi:hypothetical protein
MPILFVAATIRVNSRAVGGMFGPVEVIVEEFRRMARLLAVRDWSC